MPYNQTTTNTELLKGCIAGDTGAIEQFYYRYKKTISRGIKKFLRSHVPEDFGKEEVREDIFMKVFMYIMQDNFSRLTVAHNWEVLRPLVKLIAYQVTAKHYGRIWSERKTENLSALLMRYEVETVLDRLSMEEASCLVTEFLGILTPLERRILELKFKEKLSYREIGKKVNLSISAVGARLSRLMDRFEEFLRGKGPIKFRFHVIKSNISAL